MEGWAGLVSKDGCRAVPSMGFQKIARSDFERRRRPQGEAIQGWAEFKKHIKEYHEANPVCVGRP